jgi:ribose transport system permease protein
VTTTDPRKHPAGRTIARPAAQRGWTLRQLAIQACGLGFFYVVVLVIFSIESDHFLTYSNLTTILASVAVLGIVSIGQAIAIIGGGFDLSVSGTLPLGAVVYADLVNHGMPYALAVIVAVLIGAVVGAVNGFIVARLGINPLITTLGTLSIAGGLAYTITNGVTQPFNNAGAGLWGNAAFHGIQWGVIAFVIIAIAGAIALRLTVFGRSVYALGGNAEASRLAGLRVPLLTGSLYVICGALAAFAGVIAAAQLFAGSATLDTTANLQSITAVILGGAALTGGVGGIGGTVLGVLLLGTIENGMALMQVQTFYQQIATGVVLLIAVGFGRLRTVLGASARERKSSVTEVPSPSPAPEEAS